MKTLVGAIIQEESGGDARIIGDLNIPDKAYGPMQIRQPVCDDVNRVYGTHFKAQDMLGSFDISIAVFSLYMSIFATRKTLGFEPTDETRARIWNGGPIGWKKTATEGYWIKVKKAMGT